MCNKKKYINAFTFPEMAVSLLIVSVIFLGMMFMYGEIAKQMQREDLVDSVRDSIYLAVDEIVDEMQQGCEISIDDSGFLGVFRITIKSFNDNNGNGIGGCGFQVDGSNEGATESYEVTYTSTPEQGILKNNEEMNLYGNKYLGEKGPYTLTIKDFKCKDAEENSIGDAIIYNMSGGDNPLSSYIRTLEIDFELKSKTDNIEPKEYNIKRTIFNMNELVVSHIGDDG